jgi:peptide-methionine (S)-S-oxide reductase
MVGSDRPAPPTRGDLSGRDAQSDHSTPGCRGASFHGTFIWSHIISEGEFPGFGLPGRELPGISDTRQGGSHIATSITPGTKYPLMEDSQHHEVATFAFGCFWDIEALFRRQNGVVATRVGYTGGFVPDPTYEQVSSGATGHVEAVQLVFDPAIVSYSQLLDLLLSMVDPSCEQDDDARPIIFYHSSEQRKAAEISGDRLQYVIAKTPPVEILPAGEFWEAEECHQQYYEKCGQGYCISENYRE